LINLSIDDNKLSHRFYIRNTDPESHKKDITPKLSNFYNPKYIEEYFVLVRPTYINPINMNTLSSFSISNKICTWKIFKNNFYYESNKT
jgi:hypothetical protein